MMVLKMHWSLSALQSMKILPFTNSSDTRSTLPAAHKRNRTHMSMHHTFTILPKIMTLHLRIVTNRQSWIVFDLMMDEIHRRNWPTIQSTNQTLPVAPCLTTSLATKKGRPTLDMWHAVILSCEIKSLLFCKVTL